MGRDMYNIYRKIPTAALRENRSIKYARLQKLRSLQSFFISQEINAIENQIRSIDAELARRRDQERLI